MYTYLFVSGYNSLCAACDFKSDVCWYGGWLSDVSIVIGCHFYIKLHNCDAINRYNNSHASDF